MTQSSELTKQEIIDNWEHKAMYVELQDGSDSLLQENGYTLREALDLLALGCKIYFDK